MENLEKTLKFTAKDVAADIVYMSGGIDPHFVSVNEIVTDTLAETGIKDEEFIESFTLKVYNLISSAIVEVRWPADDTSYVFNEDEDSED